MIGRRLILSPQPLAQLIQHCILVRRPAENGALFHEKGGFQRTKEINVWVAAGFNTKPLRAMRYAPSAIHHVMRELKGCRTRRHFVARRPCPETLSVTVATTSA